MQELGASIEIIASKTQGTNEVTTSLKNAVEYFTTKL